MERIKRGTLENLIKVWEQSTSWERCDGAAYYHVQHSRMEVLAKSNTLSVEQVAGAFAALSPNTDEKSNYVALNTCIGIITGSLPFNSPVHAYPLNRAKALDISTWV